MMKMALILFTGVAFLLLTSATVVQPTNETPQFLFDFELEKEIDVVEVTIAKYPPPLDIDGRNKYHVTINGVVVGMIDEDAELLMSMFNIKPYTGKQFYEKNLGHTIWVSKRRETEGFPSKFAKNEL